MVNIYTAVKYNGLFTLNYFLQYLGHFIVRQFQYENCSFSSLFTLIPDSCILITWKD